MQPPLKIYLRPNFEQNDCILQSRVQKNSFFLEPPTPEPPDESEESISKESASEESNSEPEVHVSPPPKEKPRRVTIITKIKDFFNRRAQSAKPNTNEASHSARDTLTGKPMKKWTCSDTEDFMHKHQFNKFAKIFPQADGKCLYQLYLMSQDNNNKLFQNMKEENPEIKISDYFRFVKTLREYAEPADTNN
jgi:hypothetical protein